MRILKLLILVIWFVITIVIVDVCFNGMTQSDTLINYISLIGLIIYLFGICPLLFKYLYKKLFKK